MFGTQPNTVPETEVVPESGAHPPSKERGATAPPVTPVHPGALTDLMEVLQGATIVEEHRVLMGTVIERIQFTENGLTEACRSLLTGFEVSDVKREKS